MTTLEGLSYVQIKEFRKANNILANGMCHFRAMLKIT